MTLKASIESDSSSALLRVRGLLVRIRIDTPLTFGTSVGDGRKSITASSNGCTPLFLNAVPLSTGTKVRLQVPIADAALEGLLDRLLSRRR